MPTETQRETWTASPSQQHNNSRSIWFGEASRLKTKSQSRFSSLHLFLGSSSQRERVSNYWEFREQLLNSLDCWKKWFMKIKRFLSIWFDYNSHRRAKGTYLMHWERLQWQSWKQGGFPSAADAVGCTHSLQWGPSHALSVPTDSHRWGSTRQSPNFQQGPQCLHSPGCDPADLDALSRPVCKHQPYPRLFISLNQILNLPQLLEDSCLRSDSLPYSF